jgi:hypothetical protein
MMRWQEHAETLTTEDHGRLVLDLIAGLHEARRAAEIVRDDGDLEALRGHLDAALCALTAARCRLSRS